MAQQEVVEGESLLFDTDRLYELTSERIVQQGLDDFKEKRVTSLLADDDGLSAEVEDASTGDMRDLSLALNEQGRPVADCACSDAFDHLCRHAVAALFAHAADHAMIT